MSQQKDFVFTKRVLNGKTYDISVSLFNPILGYSISVLDNMLQRIRIDNDIDSFYPRCSIVFDDIGGKYTNHYTQYGQYLRIIINAPVNPKQSTKNRPQISMIFLVNNHKLLDYDPKKLRYEIQGIFYYELSFSRHLNYATNKNNAPLSPYLLIKNILNNVNINIKTQIPPCKRLIHFISDQNKTVKDYIKYCLMMGASQQDPPAYLYYHIINQQPILFTRNFIYNEPDYSCNMQLVIPTVKGNEKIDNSLIVYNATIYNHQNSQHFYQTAALQHRWNYDTSKRIWIKKVFQVQKYQQLLSISNEQNSKLKTSFDIQKYEENNIRLYSANYQYNIYARLHNLQTCTNCMQFFVQGNIIRDCGQIINITCKDNNFANIYGGTWQVYSVSHYIQGDRYSNILNCYRTMNYNFRPKN